MSESRGDTNDLIPGLTWCRGFAQLSMGNG
jgi:hypothetical protein